MVVVVTGATSGFGRGIVREFLRRGSRVVATGRRLSERREILAEERRLFPSLLIERDLDLAEPVQVHAFVEFCREELQGKVDVLVNNAGFGVFGALEDTSDQQIRAQMEVNFFGVVFLIRGLLPLLRATKGRVINLSSVLGFTGFPLSSLYCASKYALEGLSESLYYEFAPHGVQVCLVEPGSYQTGFGANVGWAERPSGAYEVQTRNYHALRESLNSGKTLNDPADVPQAVLRLAFRRCMPLRQRVGIDSKAAYLAKRLLPSFLYLKALSLFFSTNINRR